MFPNQLVKKASVVSVAVLAAALFAPVGTSQSDVAMPNPPEFPFEIDAALAAQGRPIYHRNCANCHDPAGSRTRTVIPIDEIGTDRERLDTWTQEAADKANEVVASFGITRKDMLKTEGYLSHPLDGVWLRAPYLHNGSVWSLRDLLESPSRRTRVFWRGFDVYDPDDSWLEIEDEAKP